MTQLIRRRGRALERRTETSHALVSKRVLCDSHLERPRRCCGGTFLACPCGWEGGVGSPLAVAPISRSRVARSRFERSSRHTMARRNRTGRPVGGASGYRPRRSAVWIPSWGCNQEVAPRPSLRAGAREGCCPRPRRGARGRLTPVRGGRARRVLAREIAGVLLGIDRAAGLDPIDGSTRRFGSCLCGGGGIEASKSLAP